MRPLLSVVITLVFALWFGGTIALFIFVQTLFAARHGLGAEGAPALFAVFERYQLFLAAVALAGTFLWWVVEPRRLKIVLFILFALAAVAAVLSAGIVTPRLEALRLEGLGQTEEFRRLHAISMWVYVSQAVLLLAAGILLGLQWPGRDLQRRD